MDDKDEWVNPNRVVRAIKIELLVELPVNSPQELLDKLKEARTRKLLEDFFSKVLPEGSLPEPEPETVDVLDWSIAKKRVIYTEGNIPIVVDDTEEIT